MNERNKLEAAITHADEVALENLGTPCGQEHKQLAQWLRQLHAYKHPLDEPGETVVDLQDRKDRTEQEADESVLYVEALWGKKTTGFNVAIRDLEGMRRGTEAPGMELRPPETDYEAVHAILHIRALANDAARFYELDHLVREGDDRAVGDGKGT